MDKFTYTGLLGQEIVVDLVRIFPKDLILHSTPDENISGIEKQGLKTGMPQTKQLVDIPAIWATIPSKNPSTSDLFRYYDDWSVVVIDPNKIPNHSWYEDFLGKKDASNNGKNKHIMTFEDIPTEAIVKIIKP